VRGRVATVAEPVDQAGLVTDRITEVLGVPVGGLLVLSVHRRRQELPVRVAGVTFTPGGVPVTLWVTSTHPDADPRRVGVPWSSITALFPEV